MDYVSRRAVAGDTAGYSRRREAYVRAILKRFPGLPSEAVEQWSLTETEALQIGLFLEAMPQGNGELGVLDLGPPDGLTALHLAEQPKVIEVVCAGEDIELSGYTNAHGPPFDTSLLEVSREALADFQEREVIKLPGEDEAASAVGLPTVVLIRGAGTRESTEESLRRAFEANSEVLALVSGCRGERGPFVQAGMVDFVQQNPGVKIRNFSELGPGLANSGLSLLYSSAVSERAERSLDKLASGFSKRLDPLVLLAREEELIRLCNRFKEEAEQSQVEIERLGEQKRLQRLKAGYEEMKENNGRLHEENQRLNGELKTAPHRAASILSRALRPRR